MFEKARIKLAGWYLLIIMFVSLSFTSVIYRASTFELGRFAEAQRTRFERRSVVFGDENVGMRPPVSFVVDDELIQDAKGRILRTLILINLGIMSIATALGYYLSGRTLKPIQEMVDKQDRFISDASHELKTPITAIKSTLEVALRDKELSIYEARKTINSGLEEVDRLQKLTEGLLELTHAEGTDLHKPINISKLVDEAVKVVNPLADKKKISIEVKCVNKKVVVNPVSLVRAIVGILDNAIKYSDKNTKIEITTKVSAKSLQLRIKDHGKGIETSELPHIFDRFYRGDRSRSTSGYGLGLSLAKHIIEANKGEIRVESKMGMGTTIGISFPYSASIQN